MGTALASKHSDLEACVEEVGEDGWAEIAGSLRNAWISVSLQWKGVAARGQDEISSSVPLPVRL